MSKATNRRAVDTWVRSDKPTANYHESAKLGVKGPDRYAFVYFGRPFPLGATIISAKLRFQTYAMTQTGTHTMKVRRTGSRTTLSRLNWKNKPDAYVATEVSASKSGTLPGGTEWEIDVTAIMQQVSDGTPWYGFRIATSDTVDRWIYSAQSTRVPTLEVEWSDAPDQPDNLVPSNNLTVGTGKPVLRFDYVDVSQGDEIAAVQVQINSTNNWPAPIYDSGEVSVTEPEFDLSTSSYAGLASGASAWWRVRAKDASGLWSIWSDGAQFRYVPRPTVTITSPTSAFYDSTQTVAWSLSGGTQTAYQVLVRRADNPTVYLWNSGKITSSDNALTIPKNVIRWDDKTYMFTVRVWDAEKRAGTPGSPVYRQQTVESFFDDDKVTPGVTTLTATTNEPKPYVTLRWSYGSLPDAWEISRNGKVIDRLESDEIEAGTGGVFTYTDRTAVPRKTNVYYVRPVVNGKRVNGGNKSATVTPKPYGIWLLSDTDEVVFMGQDAGTWSMGEQATTHEVLGASKVVAITQGLRGYEGEISGLLVSGVPGTTRTAQQWRDKLLDFKEMAAEGKTFRLVVSDMNIPVTIGNVVPKPTPEAEIQFEASFSFWQSGELGFDAP